MQPVPSLVYVLLEDFDDIMLREYVVKDTHLKVRPSVGNN